MPVLHDLPLYRPPNPASTATFRFLNSVNVTFNLSLTSYHDLYNWSITHIDNFWSAVWDETDLIGHKAHHVVDKAALPPVNPSWFAFRLSMLAWMSLTLPIGGTGSLMPRLTGQRTCYDTVLARNLLFFKLVRFKISPAPQYHLDLSLTDAFSSRAYS
jgi:hypothetical protein